MTQLAGAVKRRMIATLVGVVLGLVACVVGYRLIFSEMIREFARAHETSRVVLFLAITGLVVGFVAYGVVISMLERRARLLVEGRRDAAARSNEK